MERDEFPLIIVHHFLSLSRSCKKIQSSHAVDPELHALGSASVAASFCRVGPHEVVTCRYWEARLFLNFEAQSIFTEKPSSSCQQLLGYEFLICAYPYTLAIPFTQSGLLLALANHFTYTFPQHLSLYLFSTKSERGRERERRRMREREVCEREQIHYLCPS